MEEQKSITKIIEEVVDDICMHYCKWPDQWNEDDGELSDSEICQNCPLNRLE